MTHYRISAIFLPMDLEAFRKSTGRTWQQLSDLIGAKSAAQARRYALGEQWPREDRLAQILERCGGEVDMFAMHRRRIAWCRAKRSRPLQEGAASARVA